MTFLEYLSYKRIGLLAEAILPAERANLGNYTVSLNYNTEGGSDDYMGRTRMQKTLNVSLRFDVRSGDKSFSGLPELKKDHFVYLYHFLKNRIVAMIRQEKPAMVNLRNVRQKLEEISGKLLGPAMIKGWKLTLVLDKAIDIALEELNKGSDEGYVLAGKDHDLIVTRTGVNSLARSGSMTDLKDVDARGNELESKGAEMERRRANMAQAKSAHETLSGRRRQRGYYSPPTEAPASPAAATAPEPPAPAPAAPAPSPQRKGWSWFSS